MSSFATAASRFPEKENDTSGSQANLLAPLPDAAPEIELPSRVDAPLAGAALGASSPILQDAVRVERILSQLEARSQALVPYAYGALRDTSPPKSNNTLLACVLVALWLTSLILAVAYIRYVGHPPFNADRAAAAPLVITPESDSQEERVAASVDHLARALVTSSERMSQLEVAVEKSKRDLQKIAGRRIKGQTFAKVSVPVAPQAETVTVKPPIPKNWHRVLNIKPTDAATPHKTAYGTVDYWLVPRSGEASPSKVLPIGNSADGVIVHNLEDGKDYTLTPGGEWKKAPPAAGSSGN